MSEPRWGAQYEEWTHWANTLGLVKDLLPVVCKPGCRIASGSKLTSYGKVPSLYNMQGDVSGLAKWTSKIATVPEVRAWREQPDYGICLQTRHVRALDCDLTDPHVAKRVKDFFAREVRLPCRLRADSSKFLLLFVMPGEYGKRTMKTAGGMIEFLSNGQQCLVAGTHKDGARYEWEGGLPPEIPILTPEEFERLWELLAIIFAIEEPTESRVKRSRTHAPTAPSGLEDSVLTLIHAKNLTRHVDPTDGRVFLWCPWRDQHTKDGDLTETVYFPAGTGGYDRRHFVCLHAHCQSKTDADFLDSLGWTLQGFEDVTAAELVEGISHSSLAAQHVPIIDTLKAFGVEDGEDLVGSISQSAPAPLAVVGRNIKTGLIPPTIQNITIALERPDVTHVHLVRDAFNDNLLIGPDYQSLRQLRDEDYTKLSLMLTSLKFDPKISFLKVREAALNVADEHTIDSGLLWAETLPAWDGQARVERFYLDYLGCEDSPYARALGLYQWTAQAGRLLTPGCQADMVPVWVGEQGSGKTSAVRNLVLCPDHYIEINLGDDHKDIARSMRGALVGELSELRGIRGREMEWIKAFVTRRFEEWVPKFKEQKIKFARRLIFIGTSNREDFLADATGNRRWLPIRVGSKQDVEAIERDRAQLWAEGIHLYREGGVRWTEAQHRGRGEHHKFEVGDIWEEPVRRFLFEPQIDGVAPIHRPYITTWEVLRDCLHFESKQAAQFAAIRVAGILRRLGYEEREVRSGARHVRVWVQELL